MVTKMLLPWQQFQGGERRAPQITASCLGDGRILNTWIAKGRWRRGYEEGMEGKGRKWGWGGKKGRRERDVECRIEDMRFTDSERMGGKG